MRCRSLLVLIPLVCVSGVYAQTFELLAEVDIGSNPGWFLALGGAATLSR